MAPLDTATTAELDATASASEPMKSLRTGLRVLLEFEHDQRDFSVTELAVRCGLSKSQVSKILSALVDSGLLVQDPVTRTYSVGQRCYVLGSRFTTYDSLCQATTPVMRELLNRTGHSVRLSVPDGDQTLYLIGLEGPMFMDTGWRSGSSVPFGASSAGRVLMAYLDARTVDRLLSLPVPPLTAHTVRDRATLERMVAAAHCCFVCPMQKRDVLPGMDASFDFHAEFKECMRDPVIASDGHSYERRNIAELMREQGKCAMSPMTSAPRCWVRGCLRTNPCDSRSTRPWTCSFSR